jgi:hypothetical protein
MPLSSFLRPVRHPAAVALRLLLWPAAILGFSHLAADSEDDALAAGLTGFVVVVAACFLLALADGLVLRTRALVLVWSITTLAVAGLLVVQPLVDFLVHGGEGETWADAVRVMLEDLPSSVVFFLFLAGVPVALGAVAGAALRRSAHPGGAQAGPATGLGAPRT